MVFLPLWLVSTVLGGGGAAGAYGFTKSVPERLANLYGFETEKTVGQYAEDGMRHVFRALDSWTAESEEKEYVAVNLASSNCATETPSLADRAESALYIIKNEMPLSECKLKALQFGSEYMEMRAQAFRSYAKYFFNVNNDLDAVVENWRKWDKNIPDNPKIRNLPLILSGGFLFFKEAGMQFDSENREYAKALYRKEAHKAFVVSYDALVSTLSQYSVEIGTTSKALESAVKAKEKPVKKASPATVGAPPANEEKSVAKPNAVKTRPVEVPAKRPAKAANCPEGGNGKPGCPIKINW